MNRAPVFFHLFDTAIGTCAIAWTAQGISRVCLPDSTPERTERKLRGQGVAQTPPRRVADVARRIARHVSGEPQRFEDVALDMAAIAPFSRRVYRALRRVPVGATVTYADLAKSVGSPKAARAVGQAMANNPFVVIVPCHRVLGSTGAVGGFSAFGGAKTKRRLLACEGVSTRGRERPAKALA
jgi:methylated-DNA-[protein]-cysteine S-methyltransferase